MSSSSISVVICTCDRPYELSDCLGSISESTIKPYEVIVVDQSSSNKTERIMRNLSRCLPYTLIYLSTDVKKLSRARNIGLNACKGDIIVFTDDDCQVHSQWIESIQREFDNPQIDCICGRTEPANHKERPKPALVSVLMLTKRTMVKGTCNPVTVGKGNNMAFRKESLLKVGGFDEDIGAGTSICAGDDTDIFYRIVKAGGVILRSPDAVVFHLQPDDWKQVLIRKRGYSFSSSALFGIRMRHGDLYAMLLFAGKMIYELGYLLCGGVFRANLQLASLGLHSLLGSLSGIRFALNRSFFD